MAEPTQYRLAGVMGWPVAHSRSPVIHNHWIRQYGLTGSFVLLPVKPEQLGTALAGLPALGFAGCSVTLPHKLAVIASMHELDDSARRTGAVNLVVVQKDGTLCGHNTDSYGFIQSLLDEVPEWRAEAGPAVVLGAGGAARAVVLGLAERGASEIRLCNRSQDRAEALALDFGAPVRVLPWAQRHDALADAALLVNTTSQGMTGQAALDLSLRALPAHALVSDVIYVPLETPLLAAARARGNRTVNGLGMLLNQARPAFQAWYGVLPDITPELLGAVRQTL